MGTRAPSFGDLTFSQDLELPNPTLTSKKKRGIFADKAALALAGLRAT
jgi:hypothetical protein